MKMELNGSSQRASRRRWHVSWAGKAEEGLDKWERTLEQQAGICGDTSEGRKVTAPRPLGCKRTSKVSFPSHPSPGHKDLFTEGPV